MRPTPSPARCCSLKDLIPNPSTRGQFVPRPASTQLTNFAGFTTPAQGEALIVIGTRAYGMIASAASPARASRSATTWPMPAFVAIAGPPPPTARPPSDEPATGRRRRWR
jgi:hypothetical protein